MIPEPAVIASVIDTISTFIPATFISSALDLGMTPENLASLVLTNCTTDFLQELRRGAIIKSENSASQECASCTMQDRCKRAFNREGLICFEAMPAVNAAAGAEAKC